MTWVRSNLIEDAAISDGSPALYPAVPGKPRYPTAHGFELNDGLSLAIYHNDVRNNSGWSIIANRSRERVMLSRSVALSVSLTRTASALQPPTSTPPARTRSAPATPTLSTPASASATTASAPPSNPPRQCQPCAATPTVCNVSTGPWLHPAPGNCLGGADCGCDRPLRPRGQISSSHCRGMGGCTAQVRWFVLDFPAATPLRVVVHDSSAVPGAAPVKVRGQRDQPSALAIEDTLSASACTGPRHHGQRQPERAAGRQRAGSGASGAMGDGLAALDWSARLGLG